MFLSLSFWGGIWTIPIAWVLDRLPRGWVYWVGAVGLGALPPTLTTWFVIFPLKGLSPSNASASVGAVNALIVNGIWGLAIAFAWSRIFAGSPITPRRSSTSRVAVEGEPQSETTTRRNRAEEIAKDIRSPLPGTVAASELTPRLQNEGSAAGAGEIHFRRE